MSTKNSKSKKIVNKDKITNHVILNIDVDSILKSASDFVNKALDKLNNIPMAHSSYSLKYLEILNEKVLPNDILNDKYFKLSALESELENSSSGKILDENYVVSKIQKMNDLILPPIKNKVKEMQKSLIINPEKDLTLILNMFITVTTYREIQHYEKYFPSLLNVINERSFEKKYREDTDKILSTLGVLKEKLYLCMTGETYSTINDAIAGNKRLKEISETLQQLYIANLAIKENLKKSPNISVLNLSNELGQDKEMFKSCINNFHDLLISLIEVCPFSSEYNAKEYNNCLMIVKRLAELYNDFH